MAPLKFEAYIEIETSQQAYFDGAVTQFCCFVFYCLIFSWNDRDEWAECLSFKIYY